AVADGGVDLEGELLRRAVGELPVGTEDLQGQLVEALLEFGVRELGERAARAGMLAALEEGQRAQRAVALDLEVGPDAPELLAHHRVVEERAAVAGRPARRGPPGGRQG